MTIARILFLLSLLIGFSAQAQMYKWAGPDGKINYSDKPPPASVTNVEIVSSSGSDKGAELPYALAQAVKKMPVTLYSANSIPVSADARTFLMQNGIPFTEKTVASNEEINKLKEISGGNQLPILFIGGTKLTGFNANEWRTTLTQAGYPESNVLPSKFHFSQPQPLVPTAASHTTSTEAVNAKPSQPAQPERDPNGFHF
jgi:glutaredoxin